MKGLRVIWVLIFSFLLASCTMTGDIRKGEELQDESGLKITYGDLKGPDEFWPDEKFKDVFISYWLWRFQGKAEEAFQIEAPYFQEIISDTHYRKYVQLNPNRIVGIKFLDIQMMTQRFYFIDFALVLEGDQNYEKSVGLRDEWIFYNEEWYHVWRDKFIFPSVS